MNNEQVLWAGVCGLEAASLPQSISGMQAVRPWLDYVHDTPTVGPPAAVVLLFIPAVQPHESAQLVLTRRSLAVRTHKGQIGFAGGRAEPGDETPAGTALRELEEELGVPRSRVQVHGTLPPLPSLDGRPVVPVIATAAWLVDEFVAAPSEVEAVICASWTRFCRHCDQAFMFNVFGHWRSSHLFQLPPERVWGLTAKILFDADLR